jgi:hypothetical protein
MIRNVTFVEACKSSQWVKRRGWRNGYMLVSRSGPILRASSVKWNTLTYEDLIANDWISYVSQDDPEEDDSTKRFRLLEIE